MTAWHGSEELKQATLAQLRQDLELDRIVQGDYWRDGRGCQLGCLTRRKHGAHLEAERLFGLSERVGYWLDAVFEGLPESDCAAWVIDSAAAIPAGGVVGAVGGAVGGVVGGAVGGVASHRQTIAGDLRVSPRPLRRAARR